MIQFSLKCAEGHRFDSWFQSGEAFDRLKASGHVACSVCGSERVEKAMMAPRVNHGDDAPAALAAPENPMQKAIARLRRHVEETSDYVGDDFAREARAMHLGDVPERPIWGEAKREEARALVEDGIPVAPLPFTPSRKSN